MKTTTYNPSPLEVEFANALTQLRSELEAHLSQNKIDQIENNIQADNPFVKVFMTDEDGDKHQMVIKLIQKPDQDQ
jgi:hypothetical protein